MRTNELITGVKQDVAINIYGNNIDSLASIAKHVANEIANVDGVGTPVVERVSGLPQLQVIYDRARLSAYGISIDEANNTLQSAFAGATAGSVFWRPPVWLGLYGGHGLCAHRTGLWHACLSPQRRARPQGRAGKGLGHARPMPA